MPRRFRQVLLILSMGWLSWLAMMLIHETGHVLGAVSTGGVVTRLIWFPTELSRTDASPNPKPTMETWAGPVVGSVIPVLLAAICYKLRFETAYLLGFFAGFCLIANGTYIGLGFFWAVGDAKVLLNHGAWRPSLAIFGVMGVVSGFGIWEKISPRFGFGRSPASISQRHVLAVTCVAVVVTATCWGTRSARISRLWVLS